MGKSDYNRVIRVAIIGGGISGIGQAVRLKEKLGAHVDLTVYEKNDEAGGIWYTSQWPGAGVDVPIHAYALWSDPKADWSTVYAGRDDVFHYWQKIIKTHGLRDSFSFNTEFVSSHWSEVNQEHNVTLVKNGKEFQVKVDVLISATGPLARRTFAKIPGFDQYKGKSFHNLDWDTSVSLEGKRIAVFGSGSSAIQLIPGVAEIPGVKLTQFIRSGGYFVRKRNEPYSSAAKWGFSWIPGLRLGYRYFLFWKFVWARWDDTRVAQRFKQEQALLKYLGDEAPAEYLPILKPDYPLGCKRVAHDAGWLKSLHRANVELVGDQVVSADATGLTTRDGTHREFDVIIFATGADVAGEGVGLNKNVFGQDGKELRDFWKSLGGAEALDGLAVPGFPNYFITIGPNATAVSWGYTSATQTGRIADFVKALYDYNLTSVQPRLGAFTAYNAALTQSISTTTLSSSECSSWFKTKVGGKVTVPGTLTGYQLWKKSLRINWSDWVAVRRTTSDKTSLEVNVSHQVHQRHTLHRLTTVILAAVVGVVVDSRADFEYGKWVANWGGEILGNLLRTVR